MRARTSCSRAAPAPGSSPRRVSAISTSAAASPSMRSATPIPSWSPPSPSRRRSCGTAPISTASPGRSGLAERLCEVTFADKVFFCNSGAEACEGAIKLARRYHFADGHPEKWRIVTFKGAFHGRTLATIAAAGNEKYLEGFGEPAPGFDIVPFGDLAAVRGGHRPGDGRHHGRAGAGRGRRARRRHRLAQGAARAVRSARAAAGAGRGAIAAWAAPASCSPRVGRHRRRT